MPRAFEPEEIDTTRARLMEAARARFSRHGVRRTRISDLTGDVGIGKGTFYHFFSSKEALFFAIHQEMTASIRARLIAETEALEGDPQAMLRRFFEVQVEMLADEPLIRLVADPEEMEALMRKVPPEEIAAHRQEDVAFFEGLLGGWKARGLVREDVDAEVASELPAALLGLIMQRELVSPDHFDAVVGLIIEGLVARLSTGGAP